MRNSDYSSASETGDGLFSDVRVQKGRLDSASRSKVEAHWTRRILNIISAGIICGLLAVLFSISAATLLFSAELTDHIAVGIGMCLIGTIVLSCVIALGSSYTGMMSVSQEITMVTLALVATSIYATMNSLHSDSEIVATIIVMVALATSITGAVLFGLGVLRLGRLIRFIPYPVIGGFLAGMGWLIVFGAMTVIVGDVPTIETFHTLFEPGNIAKWVPAAAFACIVGVLSKRLANAFVLPVATTAALCLFHVSVWILELPLSAPQLEGWLLHPPQEGRIWTPFSSNPFIGVSWAAIWREFPNLLVMIAVTVTSVLFASSGIELSLRRDLDLDQELRAAGTANLIAGVAGGAPGFQGLGLTLLASHLGAPYRIVGVFVALICAAVLFFGASLLSYIPIPLVGGLLFWIGGSLLFDWLVTNAAKVTIREYCIVLLIVFLIASVGLLEGLLAGVFAAAIFFIVEYSRVDIIKYAMTADTLHSSFERDDETRRFLSQQGKHTLVLRLQGFVFFGSVHRLQQFIRARFETSAEPEIRFLILDCRNVSGLDSSADMGFVKIREMVHGWGGVLIITNLDSALMPSFAKGSAERDIEPSPRLFEDLDQALVWCEDCLLESFADGAQSHQATSIEDQFSKFFQHPNAFQIVRPFMQQLDLAPDHKFINQGDPSDAVFFIETGQVSVQLEAADKSTIRLRTFGAGTIVGEITFCLRQSRTASVVTNTPTKVWSLSHADFMRMSDLEPTLSAAFQTYLLSIMAERVGQANRLIRSLTD